MVWYSHFDTRGNHVRVQVTKGSSSISTNTYRMVGDVDHGG